jgi:class 3 adenylate cyclase
MAERHLRAAVLSADAIGYSKMSRDDELVAGDRLRIYRLVFADTIAGHGGRVVDTSDDRVLALFDHVDPAVESATEIQKELTARNADLDDTQQMHFRIGIDFGDVVENVSGAIHGEAVDTANHLEALALPGGITISGYARDGLSAGSAPGLQSMGAQRIKNRRAPVRIYRVAGVGERAEGLGARRTKIFVGAFVAALVIFAGVVGWSKWREIHQLADHADDPPNSTQSPAN